jgi:7-cyano-7-deazaguanine reductase
LHIDLGVIALSAVVASSTTPTVFPAIEIWPNQYPGRDFTITIESPEFTSVCPKTGLPDFGVITINYTPDQQCIELKAFKYYLLAYRNHGMFYENVVNKILDDIVAACDPTWIEVLGEFTPRGGISTSVRVEHRK